MEPERNEQPDEFDLIWGAREIAKTIRKSSRQTHDLLTRGLIPAQKIGGRWVADKDQLREHFRVSVEA